MLKMFSWHSLSIEERRQRAKQWFEPFRIFKGSAIVRNARSTGKPHLYIQTPSGEVAVTRKKVGFLTHFPSYTGPCRYHSCAKSVIELVEELNKC